MIWKRTGGPGRRCLSRLKFLPKHRFITKAVKTEPPRFLQPWVALPLPRGWGAMCQAVPPEAERVRGATPCAHPPMTLSSTGLLKSPVPSPLSYQRGVGTARRPGGWAALVCSPISGAVTLQHLRDGKQQRGRSSAKPGVWALNYGRERCWRKRGGGSCTCSGTSSRPQALARPF